MVLNFRFLIKLTQTNVDIHLLLKHLLLAFISNTDSRHLTFSF